MGKPLTRDYAGLVWTYIEERGAWETPCGLSVWQWSVKPRQYVGEHADGYHPTLRAACEAEAAHRAATPRPSAPDPSPTLSPEEDIATAPKFTFTARPADPPVMDLEAEREAQRADDRAHYRRVIEWTIAGLVVAGLVCAGLGRG